MNLHGEDYTKPGENAATVNCIVGGRSVFLSREVRAMNRNEQPMSGSEDRPGDDELLIRQLEERGFYVIEALPQGRVKPTASLQAKRKFKRHGQERHAGRGQAAGAAFEAATARHGAAGSRSFRAGDDG